MAALYIFSGLPGTGKSTLAKQLAKKKGCVYIRIDAIEDSLRRTGQTVQKDEGYQIAYSIAEENLRLGNNVVADSCNPLSLTREAWMDVAECTGSDYTNIEVVCSDKEKHRIRVENRSLPHPTWAEVLAREYHGWQDKRIVIDTAHSTPEQNIEAILNELDKSAS